MPWRAKGALLSLLTSPPPTPTLTPTDLVSHSGPAACVCVCVCVCVASAAAPPAPRVRLSLSCRAFRQPGNWKFPEGGRTSRPAAVATFFILIPTKQSVCNAAPYPQHTVADRVGRQTNRKTERERETNDRRLSILWPLAAVKKRKQSTPRPPSLLCAPRRGTFAVSCPSSVVRRSRHPRVQHRSIAALARAAAIARRHLASDPTALAALPTGILVVGLLDTRWQASGPA